MSALPLWPDRVQIKLNNCRQCRRNVLYFEEKCLESTDGHQHVRKMTSIAMPLSFDVDSYRYVQRGFIITA
jgi:hypothetical protein